MRWENVKKRIAAALLYAAVFLSALSIFVVNGIDNEALRTKLETVAARNGNVLLSIGHAGFSLPASLNLGNVIVKDKAGTKLRFENLTARPLLLPLFYGRPTLRLKTVTENGELVMDLSTAGISGELRRIRFSSRDFPIQQIVMTAAGKELPINGELSGEGELELPSGPPSLPESAGSLRFSLKNVEIKNGFLGEGLLKKITPKSLSCELQIEKRRLKTRECVAVAPVGRFELRLSSLISKKPAVTPLRGTLVVTPTGDALKKLLAIYPKRRRPDGRYNFPLKGTLAHPGIDL